MKLECLGCCGGKKKFGAGCMHVFCRSAEPLRIVHLPPFVQVAMVLGCFNSLLCTYQHENNSCSINYCWKPSIRLKSSLASVYIYQHVHINNSAQS